MTKEKIKTLEEHNQEVKSKWTKAGVSCPQAMATGSNCGEELVIVTSYTKDNDVECLKCGFTGNMLK